MLFADICFFSLVVHSRRARSALEGNFREEGRKQGENRIGEKGRRKEGGFAPKARKNLRSMYMQEGNFRMFSHVK